MDNYFSLSTTSLIKDFSTNAKIHFIGVAGVAMSQLAAECVRQGMTVTGSDMACYPPADKVLGDSGIVPLLGYNPENIPHDTELVIIGNAVSRNNPEVEEVRRRKLPFTSFPQALSDILLDEKTHSLVVMGTHGKTTTSAACAFCLNELGVDPRYFIGGVVPQLHSGLKVGKGSVAVFEGDEYDSGFFAKCAKFHFYKPTHLILTSLEFDHADIYPSMDELIKEFAKLLGTLNSDTPIVACIDYPAIRSLIAQFNELRWITYSADSDEAMYSVGKKGSSVSVRSSDGSEIEIPSRLSGLHNALNYTAVLHALASLGFSQQDIVHVLAKFEGVLRRQQVRFDAEITIVEDFAHHPRAVQETISAMREKYPGRRIVAIFEPRSHTSRHSYFLDDYVAALSTSDIAIVQNVLQRALDKKEDLLDIEEIVMKINSQSKSTEKIAFHVHDTVKIIEKYKEVQQAGDVVLIMSNGSFGGLIEDLISELSVE